MEEQCIPNAFRGRPDDYDVFFFFRFIFFRQCGCVISDKALKEVPSETCHKVQHVCTLALMYCSNDYMYKYILDCEFQNADTFKIIRLNVHVHVFTPVHNYNIQCRVTFYLLSVLP